MKNPSFDIDASIITDFSRLAFSHGKWQGRGKIYDERLRGDQLFLRTSRTESMRSFLDALPPNGLFRHGQAFIESTRFLPEIEQRLVGVLTACLQDDPFERKPASLLVLLLGGDKVKPPKLYPAVPADLPLSRSLDAHPSSYEFAQARGLRYETQSAA